ncbi:MAG: SAM-dependent methyltransferase [Betaproteobacteria bacterium]|nr:SAM-dependent methyltransferase [Betaproteobacteria bacterium]
MNLFPLFANLSQRCVLVVGGGEIAERKIRLLTAAGAQVRVVAPTFSDSVRRLENSGDVRLHEGAFDAIWLDNVWFVVAATDDREVNQTIAQLANERRLLVNVVDDAELSSCHIPAIIDRSPITIAISSSGAAPMIARWVRERIETMFDDSLGKLTTLAQKYRKRICAARPAMAARRNFYEWMLNGTVAENIRACRFEQAEQALLQALSEESEPRQGRVALVETGANVPGLLTLDALRALNHAELILHDNAVSADILELARRDAKRIALDVGVDGIADRVALHTLLAEHAEQGEYVVLLRSGNVFSLGDDGSDVVFLAQRGIPFRIIPGVPRLAGATVVPDCHVN